MFYYKVVGVTFANPDGTSRQEIISKMQKGNPVSLVREPNNLYDPNAIAVYFGEEQVGYIARGEAELLSQLMDLGGSLIAKAEAIGQNKESGMYYLHILVSEEEDRII